MRGQRSRKPIGFRLWVVHVFTELKQYQAGDRYEYLESNVVEIIEETTTFEELATELNDFIENECYILFYGICDRLTEGYYTS